MPGLDENQATLTTVWLVLAQVWAAQPGAGGIFAKLVGKYALDDKYLFTTVMPVRIEEGPRRPAHHGRVLRVELAERQNGEAANHAGIPLAISGVADNPLMLRRIHMAHLDVQGAAGY